MVLASSAATAGDEEIPATGDVSRSVGTTQVASFSTCSVQSRAEVVAAVGCRKYSM